MVGCICRRKGFYVRSLPAQYHDAKTPAQLRNRARMRAVMEFLSVAKGFVNHTLGGKTERMTATNVATKLNFHKVEVGEDYVARIRYGEVRLSEGGLSELAGCVGVATRGCVTLCWEGLACVGCGSTKDGVDVIARRRGQTLAQLALTWVLRDERITSVILGVSSKTQLEDSLAVAGSTPLCPEELAEIEEALK